MPDRVFAAVLCPFCGVDVFVMGWGERVIVPDGQAISVTATAREDVVEVVAARGTGGLPILRTTHGPCPALRRW